MEKQGSSYDIVVIGGGMAGLTAAAFAARGGRKVHLVERSAMSGGRARTRRLGDYSLNQGAHALYRGGEAFETLGALGIVPQGGTADGKGFALYRKRFSILPSNAWSLLATSLFDWKAKLDAARLLQRLPRIDAVTLSETTVRTWLEATLRTPAARELVRALVRLTTFADFPEQFSAETAVMQLQKAVHGVLYLHDGWQSLIDALAASARNAGARLSTASSATSLSRHDEHWCVRLSEGTTLQTGAVILAVGPNEAARLVGSVAPAVAERLGNSRGVTVSALTVALDKLPAPDKTFVLGIDAPLYLSVHSRVANLAPEGGALVELVKYLGDAPPDPERDRAELEELLDLAQPGWRDCVCETQFLPRMVAAERLDAARDGGRRGRPRHVIEELPGVFLAGDWVDARGWLSDAAASSARRAAEAAVEHGHRRAAAAA